MKVSTSTNKEGCSKLLIKLKEVERNQSRNSQRSYLNFPKVFKKIGGSLCLRKEEIWNKLYILKELGLIEIVPFHGIRLLYEVKEDD